MQRKPRPRQGIASLEVIYEQTPEDENDRADHKHVSRPDIPPRIESVTVTLPLRELMAVASDSQYSDAWIVKLFKKISGITFNEILLEEDSAYRGFSLASIFLMHRQKVLYHYPEITEKINSMSIKVIIGKYSLMPEILEKYPFLEKMMLEESEIYKKRPIPFSNIEQRVDLTVLIKDLKFSLTKEIFFHPVVVTPCMHVMEFSECMIGEHCQCCYHEKSIYVKVERTSDFSLLKNIIEAALIKHPELERMLYFDQFQFDHLLGEADAGNREVIPRLERMLRQLKSNRYVWNHGQTTRYITKNISALANVVCYPVGLQLLLQPKNKELVDNISAVGLNSMQTFGLFLGATALYWLACDARGRQLLIETPRLVNMIQIKALCFRVRKSEKSALDLFHENIDDWKKILKRNPSFRYKLLEESVLLDPDKTFYFYYEVFVEDFKSTQLDVKEGSHKEKAGTAQLIIAECGFKNMMSCVSEDRLDQRVIDFLSIADLDVSQVIGFMMVTLDRLGHYFLVDATISLDCLKNYALKKYNPESDTKFFQIGKIDLLVEQVSAIFSTTSPFREGLLASENRLEYILINYLCGGYFANDSWSSATFSALAALNITHGFQRLIAQGCLLIDYNREIVLQDKPTVALHMLEELLKAAHDPALLHAALANLLKDPPLLLRSKRVAIFECFAERILDCIEAIKPGGVTRDDILSLEPYIRLSFCNPRFWSMQNSRFIEEKLAAAYEALWEGRKFSSSLAFSLGS